MTRRLVLAFLAIVVATLVLAGAGTLLLAGARARHTTEASLRSQSASLATALAQLDRPANDTAAAAQRRRAIVRAVGQALRAQDVAVMTFGPAGRTADAPPDGISLDDLDLVQLQAGDVVSGHHGNLVYAAAGAPVGGSTLVAVITRTADSGLAPAVRWFVVAALATVVLGAVVAVTLGRRLARPVREADAAAHRIAAGELSTRLPEPPPGADDELSDLVRSINAMAASLERSRGLEHQFLLSVSHDLRTPLTSIQGYAEAISDGATKDPAWAAGVIQSEAARLERLVGDLLDLAKLQARAFSLDLRPLDVAALARATVEGFGPDAAAAGVAVDVVTVSRRPCLAVADGDRLAQVVANLVQNALKYARARITVTVAETAGLVVLSVDDDGPGIAPGDLPHVFERLYVTRHEPRRRESGSGLGLAIVHELVEAMGGTVGAEVAPGGGARLVVRLPAAPAAPAGPGGPAAPAGPGGPLPPPPSQIDHRSAGG